MTGPEPRAEARARDRRAATYARGLSAETAALLVLVLKGYRPLARRFAASGGEIDLVMRRGRTIAFVEVKARREMDTARASIDAAKRQRLSRAARAWVARHPAVAGLTLRADAVFVAPGRWPRHLPAAFELEL